MIKRKSNREPETIKRGSSIMRENRRKEVKNKKKDFDRRESNKIIVFLKQRQRVYGENHEFELGHGEDNNKRN